MAQAFRAGIPLLAGEDCSRGHKAGKLPCLCDIYGHQVEGFWDLLLFLGPGFSALVAGKGGGDFTPHPFCSNISELLDRFVISHLSRGWMKQ